MRSGHRSACQFTALGEISPEASADQWGNFMSAPESPVKPAPAPAPAEPPRPAGAGSVVPEVIWRSIVFLIALGLIVVVTTRWTRWQGGARWQSTDDAYLQSDLT